MKKLALAASAAITLCVSVEPALAQQPKPDTSAAEAQVRSALAAMSLLSSVSPEARADAALAVMTLDEKLRLVFGYSDQALTEYGRDRRRLPRQPGDLGRLAVAGPQDPAFQGHHRGGPADRDLAYHQGTVWPWLIGAYAGRGPTAHDSDTTSLLDGLELHLTEFGLGSVSETADGDAPHGATGCPFQAWSVAELIRARIRAG